MKSWTRTLNLDDAHTLLALAEPRMKVDAWADLCYGQLPSLSMARRRELVRILRDGYLDLTPDACIANGLFLRVYAKAPAMGQIDLVQVQWALSHPLSRIAVTDLVRPALDRNHLDIPLDDVETLVGAHLNTDSGESRRKTRTVLLGALEGIGVLVTRGTGQHRALRASAAQPHPIAFGYLMLRDLVDRKATSMTVDEAIRTGLAPTFTLCGEAWAERCLQWNVDHGWLSREGDEVSGA